MRPDDQIRIRHMADAARKATTFTADRTRVDLDTDELLRLALTKLVEIVGEAAKQVSPETRAALPDVPWRAAARMRDRLVHHYFDINLDVLWQTVTTDLPRLLTHIPAEDEHGTGPECGDPKNGS
jgi:uncharacterized protein with HEPN domain